MSTPPTKFEIALNNRDVISNILVYIDAELKNKTTPMDLATTERLMTKLDKAEADLMAAQTVIQFQSPKDKIDEHNKQFYDMLHITTKLHSQLQVIKMSLSTATVKPPVVTSSSSSDVRLPPLDIPKFDGNLLERSQFRDLFTTSVDKSTSLSNAQKLAHLKTLVTGEPLRLIKTLMLTDTNYGIAWSQLVKRYQNDRELLFAIYRRFMSQPSVAPFQHHHSVPYLMFRTSVCSPSMSSQSSWMVDWTHSSCVRSSTSSTRLQGSCGSRLSWTAVSPRSRPSSTFGSNRQGHFQLESDSNPPTGLHREKNHPASYMLITPQRPPSVRYVQTHVHYLSAMNFVLRLFLSEWSW
jgi:hypothetical protein